MSNYQADIDQEFNEMLDGYLREFSVELIKALTEEMQKYSEGLTYEGGIHSGLRYAIAIVKGIEDASTSTGDSTI